MKGDKQLEIKGMPAPELPQIPLRAKRDQEIDLLAGFRPAPKKQEVLL